MNTPSETFSPCAADRLGVALVKRLVGETPDIDTSLGSSLECDYRDECGIICDGTARVVSSGYTLKEAVRVDKYPNGMCPYRAANVASREIDAALEDL
jgi:hypothetical protein